MADPFVTIATIPVSVLLNQATEKRVYRGTGKRAFDNTYRSQVDPRAKREWTFTTGAMAPADVATLIAAAPHGARSAVAGLMIGGGRVTAGPVTCVVEYDDIPYRVLTPTYRNPTVYRQLTITLREV